ncbi:hypothetical protein B0H10DRAFT_2069847 [Mycena sp. CBHHK59/15]|nr:hypothetical protein B0H10DRAFT_2069847 [Mycena sp. CBHHK59/15]
MLAPARGIRIRSRFLSLSIFRDSDGPRSLELFFRCRRLAIGVPRSQPVVYAMPRGAMVPPRYHHHHVLRDNALVAADVPPCIP